MKYLPVIIYILKVGKIEMNQEDHGILIPGCHTYLCCLHDLCPQGLNSTPQNLGITPGCQLQTDNAGMCHPNFSPVPGVLILLPLTPLNLQTQLSAASSLLPGISGCVSARLFRACLGVSTLQSPRELKEEFLLLLFSRGAEVPPQACHPVFGLEGTQSWS